jgi:hypothetical protein
MITEITEMQEKIKVESITINTSLYDFISKIRYDNGELAFDKENQKFLNVPLLYCDNEMSILYFDSVGDNNSNDPIISISYLYKNCAFNIRIKINSDEYIPVETGSYKTASSLLSEIQNTILEKIKINREQYIERQKEKEKEVTINLPSVVNCSNDKLEPTIKNLRTLFDQIYDINIKKVNLDPYKDAYEITINGIIDNKR